LELRNKGGDTGRGRARGEVAGAAPVGDDGDGQCGQRAGEHCRGYYGGDHFDSGRRRPGSHRRADHHIHCLCDLVAVAEVGQARVGVNRFDLLGEEEYL